ncbi:MAG: hypothetical protein HY898_23430 [Deltaproteobacteria bacterium]|nr:hypothetical protein [Deltaproteobacteria bacterium]
MKRSHRIARSIALVATLTLSGQAGAITRDEVITSAKAFVYHPWRCETQNLTASCSSTYKSEYVPGDYLGLPYDWGGYMTLFQFDQQIAAGYGAGSPYNGDVLDCTAGVDCSGFVSQCLFDTYNTTSDIPSVTTAINQSALLPGDILNKAGYHVVLFSHLLGSGEPYLYESSPPNARVNATGGWSYVSGYSPRTLPGIQGSTATDPVGTLTHPIVITSSTYTDSRNTTQSPSDVFDGCGVAPATKESGPEYVYEMSFTQPGSLTVSVSDDTGVDIDVHLYSSGNTSDCIARADVAFTTNVDCGKYYIVADTFTSGSTSYPGAYTLNVQFTPSGGSCGSGPPSYSYKGQLGGSCSKAFPYCNMTFGAETCLLTNPESNSFCSKACKVNADCSEFAGGCCEEIGNPGSGEFYCLKAPYCSTPPVDGGTGGSGGSGGAGAGGTSGQGGSGGTAPQGGSGGTPGQGGSGGTAGNGGSGGATGNGGSGGTQSQGGSGGSGTGGGQAGLGGNAPAGNAGQPAEPAVASDDSGGCGCRTSGSRPWASELAIALAIGLGAWRRRRRMSARVRGPE